MEESRTSRMNVETMRLTLKVLDRAALPLPDDRQRAEVITSVYNLLVEWQTTGFPNDPSEEEIIDIIAETLIESQHPGTGRS